MIIPGVNIRVKLSDTCSCLSIYVHYMVQLIMQHILEEAHVEHIYVSNLDCQIQLNI